MFTFNFSSGHVATGSAKCAIRRLALVLALAAGAALPAVSLAQEDTPEPVSVQEAGPAVAQDSGPMPEPALALDNFPRYVQEQLKLEWVRQQIKLQQAQQELETLKAQRRINSLQSQRELDEFQDRPDSPAMVVEGMEQSGAAGKTALRRSMVPVDRCRCLSHARLHWLGRDARAAVLSVAGVYYDLEEGDRLGNTDCVLDAVDEAAAMLVCRATPNARKQHARLSLDTLPDAQPAAGRP